MALRPSVSARPESAPPSSCQPSCGVQIRSARARAVSKTEAEMATRAKKRWRSATNDMGESESNQRGAIGQARPKGDHEHGVTRPYAAGAARLVKREGNGGGRGVAVAVEVD